MIDNAYKTKISFSRDTNQLTMPEVKRVLLVGLNISLKGRTSNAETQEKLKLLLQLTFYLVDKLRRFKLSKEVCIHFLQSEKFPRCG